MRVVPSFSSSADDRPPNLIDEIRPLYLYADEREKFMLSFMLSTGIRIGAWNGLTVGSIEDHEVVLESGKKVRVGVCLIYGDDPLQKYITVCSQEALDNRDKYLKLRELHGEKITKLSPLLRDTFLSVLPLKSKPIRQPSELRGGIRFIIPRLLQRTGLKCNEFKPNHGFRKAHKSRLETLTKMKTIMIEKLEGHGTEGSQDSYFKAFQQKSDLFKEILKTYAENMLVLTISEAAELKRESEKRALVMESKYAEALQMISLMRQEVELVKSRLDLASAQNAQGQNRTSDT